MYIEVYCDENYPDLFTSSKPKADIMMLGSLWIPGRLREEIKGEIAKLRSQHETWGEIKWTKVCPSRQDFYFDLIDLFISYGSDMRFRCIGIDRCAYNNQWNKGDNELGFYKFYYQLIHHWLTDHNEYSIFCDTKKNRDAGRLVELHRCLSLSNMTSSITQVQALPSKEVVLIQLCDLLLGAASSRINSQLQNLSSTKSQLVKRLEGRLGVNQLCHTCRNEKKFNIFLINLRGGW